MTLSARPEAEPPRPEECNHSSPEGSVVGEHGGQVEVQVYCSDCQTTFYAGIEVAEMRRQ